MLLKPDIILTFILLMFYLKLLIFYLKLLKYLRSKFISLL
jgi:hypothetical protein